MHWPRFTGIAIAVGAVAMRATSEWLRGGDHHVTPGRFACLVALSVVFGHSVCVLRTMPQGPAGVAAATPPRWVWLLWAVLALQAIILWPSAFDPHRLALPGWLVWGVLAAFPAALADASPHPPPRCVMRVGRWRAALLVTATAVATLAVVNYFRGLTSDVGGIDFYYYVCIARDMLSCPSRVADNNYIYFPGVYAFWRTVLLCGGDTLHDLQRAYVLALLVNGLLVSAVVWRGTRRIGLALFAGLWYFVLLSRFEGLAGVSEPLATAPALAGVLLWGGRSLSGRRGLWRAAGLGAGLGLAVYMKQQAGLLALGATALLLCRPWQEPAARHRWVWLASIPLVATGVLLLGLLAEGRGWVPLQRGLQWAAGYGREGLVWRNLYTQIRGDEAAAMAAGLTVLGWCALWRRPGRTEQAGRPAFQVATFALLAFLSSLVQFASRPFGHYMLLGIPWLVVACLLVAHETWRVAPPQYTRSQLVSFLWLGCAGLLLTNTAGRTETLYAWRPFLPVGLQLRPQWHEQPLVARDLERLRQLVSPQSQIYVVAPRRSVVYYLLRAQTASRDGYQFVLRDLDAIAWDACDFVVIPTQGLDADDERHCSPAQRAAVRQHILSLGFRPCLPGELRTLELYQHDRSGSHLNRGTP